MKKVQIEWGDLARTEAIENDVLEKAEKILKFAPMATVLHVNLKIINSIQSAGVPIQGVQMELRLPNNQDVRTEKEGSDLYKTLKDAQQAILTQVKAKKEQSLV